MSWCHIYRDLQWGAKSLNQTQRTGRAGLAQKGCCCDAAFDPYFPFSINTTATMPRGKELSPQLRSRICELRRLGCKPTQIKRANPKSLLIQSKQPSVAKPSAMTTKPALGQGGLKRLRKSSAILSTIWSHIRTQISRIEPAS